MHLARRDPLHFFSTITREYGPVVRYRFAHILAHMVVLPEHVKHVLQDHQKNYTKEVLDYRILRWLLGEGLLTSEGSFWLRQRRLAQPAFHRERIQAYAPLMIDAAEQMLARWDDPAVWGVTRHVVADDAIGGFFIPRNSVVSVSPYVTDRHPDLWEEPERFDPERFDPERAAGRPRYAYFPFLGGPRQCIGNTFALMEAVLILATVAQRYRLELLPGHPVVPQALLTLRPRHGMRMTLHRAEA